VAEVIDVTIHYVGPTEGSVWAGIQQGIDEANLQGEFLGQKYSVATVSAAELSGLANPTAVMLATDADTVLQATELTNLQNVPVFNLIAEDDNLRAACLPNLLNVPASEQMKKDALAQWTTKNPDTKVQIQGWHEDFKKFAASQLNIRFKKAHGVIMDEDSWAGWAAPKLIADTVARIQSADANQMLQYLRNDIAFDGQKGAGATFRETGQLRQLVLVVDENNKIAAEAPLRGAKGGLDSLGIVSCK
jgi:hypothetical protein